MLIAGGVAFWGYNTIFTPNTAFDTPEYHLKIPKNYGFKEVKAILQKENVLKDISTFEKVAQWMNYKKEAVPSGNFNIKKGWNNREIISAIRSGIQLPIKLIFNNVRDVPGIAGAITTNIALDSAALAQFFIDPNTYNSIGYNKEDFMTLFIPNTYSVYWNITPKKLLKRLQKEHKYFWSKKDRLAKAKKQNLTPNEVYTLASIVEKESQHGPERPTIAGLYLNRLKKGIHLQADPTVVYATGNYGLRRVLNKHLKVDSPYNTYKNPGLPPGPIYMPSIQSIDAVLNPKKHDYLYMCAKPGYGTKHAFAKTLRGHNKNANAYRRWLSSEGIR